MSAENQTLVADTTTAVSEVASTVTSAVETVVSDDKPVTLATIVDSIQENSDTLQKEVAPVISDVQAKAEDVAQAAVQASTDASSQVADAAGDVKDQVTQNVTDAEHEEKDAATQVLNDTVSDVTDVVESNLSTTGTEILNTVEANSTDIPEAIAPVVDAVTENATIVKKAEDVIIAAETLSNTVVTDVKKAAPEIAKEFSEGIHNTLQDLAAALKKHEGELTQESYEIAKKLVNLAIEEAVTEVKEKSGGIIIGFLKAIWKAVF